jgi:hypothetical protein
VTFLRLRRADWAALAAALALLFVMATDWYSTQVGHEARREQRLANPQGAEAGEIGRAVKQDAQELAQSQEKNAWQAGGAIDRVILIVLLGAAGLAVAAAFLRAAGRRFEPPFTPSSLAAGLAGLGALLVTYRMVQQPEADVGTTIQAGAPLALVTLGALGLSAAIGYRHDEEGTAFREPAEGEAPPEAGRPVT